MTSKNFSPWSEKYKPNTLNEVVGQDMVIEEIKSFVKSFKKGKSKALFLHGPPGNGKTCMVQALSLEFEHELVEMNASDFRTKDSIMQKIGHAVTQQSLVESKGKIILIDEIDGIYGTSDRGGLPAIYKILSETNYPVILTANDPWKVNLRSLRTKCKTIKMKKVDVRSQVKKLAEIAQKEGIGVDKEILHEIAKISQGDLRAAINDFQSIADGKEKISKQDLETLIDREKQVDIFQTLLAIFKSKDKRIIQRAFWNSDKSPDEILLWLTENIPKEYEKAEEIALAYDRLSRADVFKGRIVHNQAWTLQSFSNELMSLGVASAKKEKYHKFTKYSPPGILIKMGRSKASRALRDKTASELGEICHCSKKRAIEQFPYMSLILKKNGYKGLSEESVDYLKKYS